MPATGLHRVFCVNLRAARLRAALTQKEAADRLDISQPAYHNFESGRNAPGLHVIEKLAKVFRIEPHQLLDPAFAGDLVAA